MKKYVFIASAASAGSLGASWLSGMNFDHRGPDVAGTVVCAATLFSIILVAGYLIESESARGRKP